MEQLSLAILDESGEGILSLLGLVKVEDRSRHDHCPVHSFTGSSVHIILMSVSNHGSRNCLLDAFVRHCCAAANYRTEGNTPKDDALGIDRC